MSLISFLLTLQHLKGLLFASDSRIPGWKPNNKNAANLWVNLFSRHSDKSSGGQWKRGQRKVDVGTCLYAADPGLILGKCGPSSTAMSHSLTIWV